MSASGDPSAQPRWVLGRRVTFERDAFIRRRFQNRLASSVGQYRCYQVLPVSARGVCFSCRGRREMNFKSSVIIFVCGIRVFRIFKTIPYQNVIRPYNSEIINNPYNIREIRIMWQVCTIDRVTTDSPYNEARCSGASLYFPSQVFLHSQDMAKVFI